MMDQIQDGTLGVVLDPGALPARELTSFLSRMPEQPLLGLLAVEVSKGSQALARTPTKLA